MRMVLVYCSKLSLADVYSDRNDSCLRRKPSGEVGAPKSEVGWQAGNQNVRSAYNTPDVCS